MRRSYNVPNLGNQLRPGLWSVQNLDVSRPSIEFIVHLEMIASLLRMLMLEIQ